MGQIKLLVLFFLCLSWMSISFAQETYPLQGLVLDKKTGDPLTGVNIFLKNTTIGTSTDSLGAFKLPHLKAGKYVVVASFMGYKSVNKEVIIRKQQKTQVIYFSLEETTKNLQEIIITEKSEARKLREQAIPVSIIPMDQLQGTVNSISDILTRTIGLTIRNTGGVGGASRLSVRGLEGKRIGFFIDETPLNDQSDFININDLPIDMIDYIEVYKGVVPAKLGGNAMGGAVNIVIKEYPERYGDFSYTHESFNTHKVQSVVKRNFKKKRITVGAGGGYTYSDNNYVMESPYIEKLKIKRKHNQFKKVLLGGNVTLKKYWFDEIEFEPVFLNTYRQIQGIAYDIRSAAMKSRAYVLANTIKKDDFFIKGLDFDMSSVVAYTQYHLIDTAKYWYDWNGNAYHTISKYGGELGNRYASNSNNTKFTILHKLNLEYLINNQHTLNFNSFFTLAHGNPQDELRKRSVGRQTVFNSKMNSLVASISYDFRTKQDKFLNSLTLRYYLYRMNTKKTGLYGVGKPKHIALHKTDFGLSNALRYHLTSHLMTKFSVAYDVRIPSEIELLGDGYFIAPTEDLLPEQNTNANLGILYNLVGDKRSNLQVEINGFYMNLTNMIRYTKSFVGAQYQNFGKMQSIGLEFEVKADLFPFLYGYINTTYQDMRDVRRVEQQSTVPNPTKGKRMPNIPYLMANTGLEFHQENLFGGTEQNTRIFTDLSFIEEYFYDFEMTKDTKRRIPRNIVLDIGCEHSFKNNRLFISGRIKNLTNAKVLSEFNRPLPTRSLGIKLRYIIK